MHTVNRHNEGTLSLEPLYTPPRPMVSASAGPDSTKHSAVVSINDPNDAAFDHSSGSPTSIYSFDSFIERSYVSTPQSLEIDVNDMAKPYPRSYFSPDTVEFDEKWHQFAVEEAIDSSSAPYTSRNGSVASLGSGRSVSPSIWATAERVKVTPVRAVRRSIRQSIASQLSAKFAPSYDDDNGGEKKNVTRPAVWRPYTAMLKLLHRADSYVAIDEAHHPSPITDATARSMHTPEREKRLPVLPPLPFAHNQYLVSEKKNVSRTAGGHNFRRSRSTPALKPCGRQTRLFKRQDSDSDVEDEDMDGIHDLTLEASEIAACLSAKWKFEPLLQGEEVHKRRASL